MFGEPWDTVLFLLVIPLLHQGFKLYKDKTGNTLSKEANQLISLGLAAIFGVLSGGFAGFGFPALPVWGGDIVEFIGNVVSFAGDLVVVIGLAWGSLVAWYEGVADKVFVKFNLATADKR
jgi:hypothetical protein